MEACEALFRKVTQEKLSENNDNAHTIAEYMLNVEGVGVFYLFCETEDSAKSFVNEPSLKDVLYIPQHQCDVKQVGDAAIGAMGRGGTVAIVDVKDKDLRVTATDLGTSMMKIKIEAKETMTVGPRAPLPDHIAERMIQAGVDAGSLTGGDARQVAFVTLKPTDKDASTPSDDSNMFLVEIISLEQILEYSETGASNPTTTQLETILNDMDPTKEVLYWLAHPAYAPQVLVRVPKD